METAFTQLVGCRVPIQQAPMGSVSTPDLAVAVADEGGVESISALGMPTPAPERLVTAVVERTAGVLAVNFLLPDSDPDAVAYAARHVQMIDCVADDTAVVEFETTVHGKYVNGVDIIRVNDEGQIVEFRVMIRPLQAVNTVHEQMRSALEAMQ
jgi:NAD(P)H-dependent flavin oxidoreductase YrpB (nitropropane dioxygenase family)